jgi:Txe/YoeB family toxin of Txe-Axe toxin-antitoxin module
VTCNFLYATLVRQKGQRVKTMTYSESRAHYAETFDAVVDDPEEVVVTRAPQHGFQGYWSRRITGEHRLATAARPTSATVR